MTSRILLTFAALTLMHRAEAAESFVKNDQERARIEAALPAKAWATPARPRRLLIFTLNVGYGGHPSMAHASEAFTLMGRKTGAFETVVSKDPAVFERESLKTFDAVFFNNTVGNCFTNAELRRNLLEFITGGGGLLGVHGTSVAFTRWPGAIEDWPEFGYLIGARGANHKDSDEHIWMKLDDADSPVLQAFGGQGFDYRDEFFRPQGTYSRQRVRVLLSIDTTKCDPNKGQARGDCFRADNDYAVAWIRSYGKGRIFYCTIAHNPYVFWDEKMLGFYLGALQFALGDLPCPTTPSAKLTPEVRAQEKLGWRLALAGGKRPAANLLETAEQARASGVAYVAGSCGVQSSSQPGELLGPQLTDVELEQVRLKLESATVRLLACEVATLPPDETSIRGLFEFGRKMGIETFVLSQPPQSLDAWVKLAETYGTQLAFRARTSDDALALAKTCRERSKLLGVAMNLNDASWARGEPARTLASVGERLLYVQLPAATGADLLSRWLPEIRKAKAKPVFASSATDDALKSFNAITLKLAGK